jgi:hypothetical protein
VALEKASAGGDVTYVKWDGMPVGTVVRGWFLDSKPNPNFPNQNNHYAISADSGNKLCLNGTGFLDLLFADAVTKCGGGVKFYFELQYKGIAKLEDKKPGHKDPHDFELAFDRTNVYSGMEQAAPAPQQAPAPVPAAPQQRPVF